MPISFAYTSSQDLEVWNGVFYSPDHDRELNRDPVFLNNIRPALDHPEILMSLYNAVETNPLLSIAAILTYADTALDSVKISDFQSDGINLIESNEDSVLLNFSCEKIDSDNFDDFEWKKSEDGSTMVHAFTHKIYASYREQNSENLTISGKITNTLPTCRLKVLFNGDEMDIGGQVDIDLESESFTIRLAEIEDKDAQDPYYLENHIRDGDSVNLDNLERLVMFRQTCGQEDQTIDSLDIVGFSLESATTTGTGKSFTLDLKYTLTPGVEVPPVNKIGLMLIDPMDLERPAETDINVMELYNFIPGIVTVMADASTPIVSLTPADGYMMMDGVRYDGFDATREILEKQPNDGTKPIDIPMTISLPNNATRVRITPSTELSGVPHDWNKWGDPQEIFEIVYDDGKKDVFDEIYDIVDNNGMDSIDIVFRIHQKEYWNGDFNLSLTISSYKEQILQGETLYELPYVILIEPINSKILIV